MNNEIKIGALLTLIGIVMYFLTTIPSLTTIIYNPPLGSAYIGNYQLSTSSSSPTYIPSNVNTMTVQWSSNTGSISYTCTQNGMQVANGLFSYSSSLNTWTASINPSAFQQGVLVSCTLQTSGGYTGTYYFIWTSSSIGYVAYINGEPVTPTSTITITNPTLNVYIAITNTYFVYAVGVIVKDASGNLIYNQTQNINAYGPLNSQTFSITLPKPGTYILNATVSGASVSGNPRILTYALSITIANGQSNNFTSIQNANNLLQDAFYLFIILGASILVYGSIKELAYEGMKEYEKEGI